MGFNDEILDVKISPDAKQIVLASNSEQVGSTPCSPGRCSRLLAVPLAVPPSSSLRSSLSSVCSQVRIFDAEDFSCQMLAGHTDIVLAVDVSFDGTLVASSSKDHTIRVWSVETRR